MNQLKFKQELLPSQERFINSTKKEILFSGAWRAGKSKILCFALLKQVIKNPHNTVLLCRKTLESLKSSTLMIAARAPVAITLSE
jgi:hypothetical protein